MKEGERVEESREKLNEEKLSTLGARLFDKEAAAKEEEAAAHEAMLNEIKAAIEKITGETYTDFFLLTALPADEKGAAILGKFAQGKNSHLCEMIFEAFDEAALENPGIMQPLMVKKAMSRLAFEL